jgi:hypothetical protein
MSVPAVRIVIDPMTGAMGYGWVHLFGDGAHQASALSGARCSTSHDRLAGQECA